MSSDVNECKPLMDGLRNERPPDLPVLGFIPVTLLFPAGHKDEPVTFNATPGFTAQRLREWAQEHADLPTDLPTNRHTPTSKVNALGEKHEEL